MGKVLGAINLMVGTWIFGVGIFEYINGDILFGSIFTILAGLNFFVAYINLND